jgi:glutamate-1-semialdehyde 2,1-aminomutase
MKKVAIVQARMGSSRLPGKVLEDLGGRPALAWIMDAARAIPGVDVACVATSTDAGDDAVAAWAEGAGVPCHRGSEEDVLDRFLLAARAEDADVILRLTGDCPLLDPDAAGLVLRCLVLRGADYACNFEPRQWPDGLDAEAFTRATLEAAASEAQHAYERQHVTPWMRSQRGRLRVEGVACPLPGLGLERWTLDTPQDLEFLREVVARLPNRGRPPSFLDVLVVLDAAPQLRELNRHAGAAGGAPVVAEGSPRFARSEELLARAERVIPLGSQTYSKSRLQLPRGAAPLFLTHGQGGRSWDVDGTEYVDLICGLLCVPLGYRDPDVDDAIQRQLLTSGISFSLATTLEAELAERLVEIVPCAEQVRFGKNGTDVTSAAIRLARAHTGRDRVAVCGYHGWQDWYVASTSRNKGVPGAVCELTHSFGYGDLAALETLLKSHPGEFAAVIMEPMNAVEPPEGYLEGVKALAHQHGALLVFDEIITGFRYALGGAQELFGVTPDLATFGKAMGNGMPISAVVGRADLMAGMEEIFFSGTFSGETLSLAAGIAVIDKMRREPVIETLWRRGEELAGAARAAIERHGLGQALSLRGRAPWMILNVQDHPQAKKETIKTFFLKGMLAQRVLTLGTHNVCYAHQDADTAHVAAAYEATLSGLAEHLAAGDLERALGCPAIVPVFQVR